MIRAQLVSTALLFLVVGGSGIAHAQDDRGRKQPVSPDAQRQQQQQQQQRVSAEEQRQRVQAQQQRATQYRQRLDQQVPVVQKQAAQLQADKRMAQYRVQQEYAAKLREQQLQQQQLQARTERDYSSDPYTITPHTYRYVVSGTARQTNQYGADVLRQAVNYGYQQGVRTGEADRLDRRPANYGNSIAYRDANYGYSGNYVDQSDYNYYFREGFRRGYDDGYNQRWRYGTALNGSTSILGNLLTSILGLQPIR